jgi:hypothetical protein
MPNGLFYRVAIGSQSGERGTGSVLTSDSRNSASREVNRYQLIVYQCELAGKPLLAGEKTWGRVYIF